MTFNVRKDPSCVLDMLCFDMNFDQVCIKYSSFLTWYKILLAPSLNFNKFHIYRVLNVFQNVNRSGASVDKCRLYFQVDFSHPISQRQKSLRMWPWLFVKNFVLFMNNSALQVFCKSLFVCLIVQMHIS